MKISIIGAGNSGLAMAAHLKIEGYNVTLWNRCETNIERLIKTRTIVVTGSLNCSVKIDLVTTNLDLALNGADLLLITTPADSHSDLAFMMKHKIKGIKAIILNPGRTLGAYVFHKIFLEVDSDYQTIIAETQSIIYTCRKVKEDEVNVIKIKNGISLACLNRKDMKKLWEIIPSVLKKYYTPVQSMVYTSIANVGMVLHCAPLLLNTGWTENISSGYFYYYEGISPSIANFIDRLDMERIKIAEALGYQIESTKAWIKRIYKVDCVALYECIQNNPSYKFIDAPSNLKHRYILEDVTTGLVPLEQLGIKLGVSTHLITLVIDLASNLIESNLRDLGRTFSTEDVIEILEILRHK